MDLFVGLHPFRRTLRLLIATLSLGFVWPAFAANTTYYVDCQRGNDGASGTSPANAWRSLAKVSKTTFSPGESILLKRGTHCSGVLAPKGSGNASSPLTLDAYGTGALPIIDGSNQPESLRLFNQEYWNIRHLDVQNSTVYGIHITGDNGVLHHIHLCDLESHHIHGELNDKDSGAVVVSTGGPNQTFEDVLIDGVRSYDVTQWSGIFVNALNSGFSPTAPRNHNVTIRNSVAHDVFGDGIIIYGAQDALIETSIDYRTGTQPTQTIGTPNGIWTFDCSRCVVQFNEGYRTTSPDVDGGVYDIDYQSDNTTVQYNYAHDADGYCVGLFASGVPTRASLIRYNVCINNGRKKEIAFQGDIYLVAFNGGTFDGVQIYNNTSIWNPITANPALVDFGQYDSAAFFANNLIYSKVPQFINATKNVKLDHNLYWTTSDTSKWTYDGKDYSSFPTYQRATRQDLHGLNTNPKFVGSDPKAPSDIRLSGGSPAIDAGVFAPGVGNRDFFGVAVPQGKAPDVGASETLSSFHPSSSAVPPASLSSFDLQAVAGALSDSLGVCNAPLTVVALIDSRQSSARQTGRSQAVFLKSIADQYSSDQVCPLIVDVAQRAGGELEVAARNANLIADWDLKGLAVAQGNEEAADLLGNAAVKVFVLGEHKNPLLGWTGIAPPFLLGPAVLGALPAPATQP